MLLLLLLLLSAQDVLVLKNGKRIACERYERNNGQVKIFRQKDTFALPEKMVDWEQTELYRRQRDTRPKTDQSPTKEQHEHPTKTKWEDLVERRRPEDLALTKKDYRSQFGGQTVRRGPVTVRYTDVQNSILVKVMINRNGPYTLILDTGASITTVSPSVLEAAGLTPTDRQIQLVGVGGSAGWSSVYEAPRISLEGAEVRGLSIVGKRIASLENLGAVGLLGQDFLNFFVMELNAGEKTVLLKPRNNSGGATGRLDGLTLADIQSMEAELQQQGGRIQTLAQSYLRYAKVGLETSAEQRELRGFLSRFPTLMGKFDQLYRQVQELERDQLNPTDQQNYDLMMRCYASFKRFLSEIQQLSRQLRTAYAGMNSQESVTRNRERVNRAVTQTEHAAANLQSCR